MRPGSRWRLLGPLNGYSRPVGTRLATQAASGRCLQLLNAPADACGRRRVRLLEDGYPCWVDPEDLLGRAVSTNAPTRRLLDQTAIRSRIAAVLDFALAAAQRPNRYLWGGTIGPDYDCSGLVQTAYASSGIWLPRDAYQQERFCQPVAAGIDRFSLLCPGDLIFFGRPQRCTHVGIHLGEGRFLHSSGREHGRDGLGIDRLCSSDGEAVGLHYRGELRGAGRVVRCHDGSTLP
jgi:cell wall-associated NlpC family hydrolase